MRAGSRDRQLRYGLFLTALAAGVAACGAPTRVQEEPLPVSAPEMAVAPQRATPVVVLADSALQAMVAVDDSALDDAMLQALQQLEFGSFTRRLDRPVALPAATPRTDVTSEAERLFGPAGGGAAAVAVTYDIDVASFTSHRRVEYYVDFFRGEARDRFQIWLGRLNRYEGLIRSRFRAEGIPEDLVYLAMIESGYSNTAVSRARAVGMWQFMSFTGRRYGLVVDDWVDDRRDPFKATDAAARHLSDLNEQFGSWYLAAAAYNAGATKVTRGIRRLPGEKDSLTDETFFALADRRYLRLETRDYVPKLIAAALIAKEPVRYGFDTLPILAPLVFDEVHVDDMTGLDVLARLADTSTAALTELNPRYFRGVTPPRRAAVVRVPRGSGTLVATRYAELPPKERVTFVSHSIARGETLSQIAQRYGVTVSLITSANRGLEPRRLKVGQRITIPLSMSWRAPRQPSVTKVAQAGVAPVIQSGQHTVRPGESLSVIAQRYGLRITDLRAWNGLEVSDVLRVGQRLTLGPGDNELR